MINERLNQGRNCQGHHHLLIK